MRGKRNIVGKLKKKTHTEERKKTNERITRNAEEAHKQRGKKNQQKLLFIEELHE